MGLGDLMLHCHLLIKSRRFWCGIGHYCSAGCFEGRKGLETHLRFIQLRIIGLHTQQDIFCMARLPSREMLSLPILSDSSHVVPCKTWAISLTSSQTGGCLFYQFLLTRGATHFHGFSMIFMFKNRFRIVVLKAFFQVNL